eukprot:1549384-Lingulodinium_polyedra.AAC.1
MQHAARGGVPNRPVPPPRSERWTRARLHGADGGLGAEGAPKGPLKLWAASPDFCVSDGLLQGGLWRYWGRPFGGRPIETGVP